MKDMIALQKSSDFNTYAYVLAEKAGIQGATNWLDENTIKIEKMSKAIKTL